MTTITYEIYKKEFCNSHFIIYFQAGNDDQSKVSINGLIGTKKTVNNSHSEN